MLIPITQSTDNLSDALDDSILVDDVDSDLFFDASEEVDCNVDTFIDIVDYTFLIQDPCTPFSSLQMKELLIIMGSVSIVMFWVLVSMFTDMSQRMTPA